ncbi:MAG: glycoside hydrolase family 31 protein [Fodinibius sp.]|nr:glycoside hydrolase family 31 protein [Fodinibius sp.]
MSIFLWLRPNLKIKDDPTEETDRKPDIKRQQRPDKITDYAVDGNQLTFRSKNNLSLHLTVHTADIIQLKYVAPGDQPTDFSYAIDPEFNPDTPDFNLQEKDDHFLLTTNSVHCRIDKNKMKVHFLDDNGHPLCSDKQPYFRKDTLMKGISEVKITKEAPVNTAYFGLGDKVTDGGLRGHKFENWNTDAYAYERGDDPLYRSIPFYAALREGRAYGIFMDNTYRSFFDFDSKGNNSTSFSAAGGCMNYYFIYGPELTTVSERYARLTGTPELPPLWGLGYHQCRWSYFPESRVRELAQDFRDKQIPCDAIYLDIDYMDDYRVFTWNNERFPDPKELITDLKEHGFETIVMIDPGIKVDPEYEIYQQGLENDYFCKRPDGDLMVAPVWPPETVFPDYTNPQVRNWWGDLYEDLLTDKKISGVWNDMNEPAVFEIEKKTFPEDVRHHFDGQPASHKKAHNIYGMQMARASYDGIKKHNDGKRPFLLTRANFAGGQRYAALWTGDNIANWDHLKLANEQCQQLSISGYSFVGTDIGGFVKNPSGELFTRWLQLSVFHPLFRNHTMGYNVDGAAAVKEDKVEQKKLESDTDQEPWSFGNKFTDINRSVIELRYRLLHYLYSAFHQHVQDGTPILRPLAYYEQSDERALTRSDEFMFGDQILVSPVLDNKKRAVETYFPDGRWYDYRTNEVFGGPDTAAVDAPLAEIPFFVKGGTVLPLREVMQYTTEHDPRQLELNIYYDDDPATSTLYEDDNEGYQYSDGNFRHTTYHWQPDPNNNTATLTAERSGSYQPDYDTVKLNIVGLPFSPASIRIDGNEVEFESKPTGQGPVCSLHTDPNFENITLR